MKNEKSFVFKTSFFACCSDVLRLDKEDTMLLGTLNVLCLTKKGCFCRDISIEIDDGSAMVNAMGAQKAKDYKCLG
jgi:hypothetical protein